MTILDLSIGDCILVWFLSWGSVIEYAPGEAMHGILAAQSFSKVEAVHSKENPKFKNQCSPELRGRGKEMFRVVTP